MKSFPVIPGVEFRLVTKTGYEGYAVSSDGRVWIGKRGKWRAMETYSADDGEESVWFTRLLGGRRFKVGELLKEAFGNGLGGR